MIAVNRALGAPSDRLTPYSRLLSRPLQYLLDLLVLLVAFAVAYWARFDFQPPADFRYLWLVQTPEAVMVQLAALGMAGVNTYIWRYVGLAELRGFLKAAFWSAAVLVVLRLGLPTEFQHFRIPLSVILVDTVLGFGGVLALRVLRRVMYEHWEKERRSIGRPHPVRRSVLLIGAGQAGVLAAREIQGRGNLDIWIEGFVDDDPRKQGATLQGRRVLGTTDDLPELVARYQIDHVIITIAQISRRQLKRIMEICEAAAVKARIIPGLYEILGGTVEVGRIRDVEIEDLLGREAVQLEQAAVEGFITGKTVMVTGAGGSIGSELCRQVARFEPGSLLLVERAEFALFDIDRELRRAWPDRVIVPLVADIGDEPRMRALFAAHRPDVVLHAAAHKHVPMMETNPSEAVKNNVLGTRLLGDLAGEYGVGAFVMISTDKAVRPTSLMGASKRVAELVVQDLDARWDTRFVAVRFGNVMGSAGSVIPIFREQIQRGGPVTVTHPDMVRYFMTIPEATQLVLQAGAMGEGGEIFILDMGEPVRILDLATDMVTLYGLKPYEDIDIVFTGLRPGEKLFEELETHGEHIEKTRHPKIYIGKLVGYPHQQVEEAVERFRFLAVNGTSRELRGQFASFLPEARLSGVGGVAAVGGEAPAAG